jgi:hypothetical protein
MKHLIGMALLWLPLVGGSHSQSTMLLQLSDFDSRSIVCGCEFRESIPNAAEGSYGSGPTLLVIAPNADPPHALVNLGRGNLKLSPVKPIKFPMFHCEVGEHFQTEWRSDALRVLARLDVVGSGEESCGFSGTVVATMESTNSEVPIKGACGC